MNLYFYIKRFWDILVVLLLLPLILILIACISLVYLILREERVFFFQKRTGLHGVSFEIYKFRTLSNSGERFPLGDFLRRTSLDEIPQLFNVLKGEMSLVGPRPLLPEYLPYYRGVELVRHSVLPGITGLAQVKGRSDLSWDVKLNYDVKYVEQRSIILDFYILLKTLIVLLKKQPIEKSLFENLKKERINLL